MSKLFDCEPVLEAMFGADFCYVRHYNRHSFGFCIGWHSVGSIEVLYNKKDDLYKINSLGILCGTRLCSKSDLWKNLTSLVNKYRKVSK